MDKKRFNIVLVAPEIPGNTGSIGRTCVALNLRLVLIKPYGFEITEKAVRRAGLDYWKHVEITEYDNFDEFLRNEKPKDSQLFFFENPEVLTVETNSAILQGFGKIIWNCYQAYRKKYGILDSLDLHKISPSVKIQKYEPGQGYHVWHCDNDSMSNSNRIIVVALYLNTVEEGGETEFLYQGIRVKPEQGTMTLIPAYYTHAHRGNPPLSGDKYYMNTWLELIE